MSGLIAFLIRFLSGAQANWRGCAPSRAQRVYFANHTSNLDTVVLWAVLPPELRAVTRPVAARDYWSAGPLRRLVSEKGFRAVLIERKKVTAGNNPLRQLLAVLDEGNSLIIFPEGTRSFGPEPEPFKSGLYHIAREKPDLELVPVYLENLNRVLPKGEFLPVPLLASVTMGAPVRLNDKETKQEFLHRARSAVWDLHQI